MRAYGAVHMYYVLSKIKAEIDIRRWSCVSCLRMAFLEHRFVSPHFVCANNFNTRYHTDYVASVCLSRTPSTGTLSDVIGDWRVRWWKKIKKWTLRLPSRNLDKITYTILSIPGGNKIFPYKYSVFDEKQIGYKFRMLEKPVSLITSRGIFIDGRIFWSNHQITFSPT